ncbi:MAG: phenylglyoxylate dehydrogenase [Chloroflexi bacterium]|nr:phenylglyoxylate dehydrogenase [Chloroflexota bacterium]MDA8186548.1 pyruvate ferredoxin oxidoreductase [Dehalococcoidales bacterium]
MSGTTTDDEARVVRPGRIAVIDGNMAAAWGAKLSRPTVLAAYPITPQTPLVEYLSTFVADGELDADMVEVESEHSALSVLQGASLAGARTFTGTSSQGLALMYEPYIRTSTLRLPIVMAIVTREVISPQSVWGGQQDAITVRDAGWIQIYVEDNQEILDSIIMAYKIAEHPDILLPVNICYDGHYLSHVADRVEIPAQEDVDRFLSPYSPSHIKLDPRTPMSVDPLTPGDILMEYRYKHVRAQARAKRVIEEVDEEFGRIFGRPYGGLLERYRLDDASLALITLGSTSGTAKVAVDAARNRGVDIGLIKLRALRPFPREELFEALHGKAAIGIVDRNVCFGWMTGVVYAEVCAALRLLPDQPPLIDFVAGLGGADITFKHYERAISLLQQAASGRTVAEVTWLGIDFEPGEEP